MIPALLLACTITVWPFDTPEVRRESERAEESLHREIMEDEAIRTREAAEALNDREEEREERRHRRHYPW